VPAQTMTVNVYPDALIERRDRGKRCGQAKERIARWEESYHFGIKKISGPLPSREVTISRDTTSSRGAGEERGEIKGPGEERELRTVQGRLDEQGGLMMPRRRLPCSGALAREWSRQSGAKKLNRRRGGVERRSW